MAEIKNIGMSYSPVSKRVFVGSTKKEGRAMVYCSNKTAVPIMDLLEATYEYIKDNHEGAVDISGSDDVVKYTIAVRDGKDKDVKEINNEFEKQVSLIAFAFGISKDEVKEKIKEWLNVSSDNK